MAVPSTTIAVTASVISRASGGCYAACPVGTTCNGETGFCDPLPCQGRCLQHERCERRQLGDQCVPARSMPLPENP